MREDIIEQINSCALKSPNHKMSRHCAILFTPNNQVICYTNNRYNKHAEMRVLAKYFNYAGFYGKKIGYMMVVRVNKSGNWVYSKPCIKCQKLLEKYNIRVVHS